MEFIAKPATAAAKLACDCLVVPVYEKSKLSELLNGLDSADLQQLQALDKAGDISRKSGATSLVHLGHLPFKRLLFIGCGAATDFADLRQSITTVAKSLGGLPLAHVAILASAWQLDELTPQQLLQQIALLFTTNSYRYDQTLSKKADKARLKKITVLNEGKQADKRALAQGQAIGNGMNTARHLGNLPPNICTPSWLADTAKDLAKQYPALTVKVLDEPQLKKLGMNALLSVTAGTEEPAKVVILEYKGGKASEKPHVLVGKGVTFDSGGISLKPGAKMDEMKFDMCGAASVIGTLQTACELALPLNITGIIGAVENLPSGKATKPGDVITSMSGQTIEVLNTDAEGRLVLCDLLTYVERFKPKTVIDIATLTGACVVALGNHASGLYSNHDALSQQLQQAGLYTYDRAWPMPLWKEYDKQLSSNFADIGNIGGPGGGSVTAACFLARFTKKYHWAHLDIAGTAWLEGAAKGGTGRPVSLLSQYLIDRC